MPLNKQKKHNGNARIAQVPLYFFKAWIIPVVITLTQEPQCHKEGSETIRVKLRNAVMEIEQKL